MRHVWIGDTSSSSFCAACGKDYRDGPDRECLGAVTAPAMPSEAEGLFLRWSSYVEAGLAASTRKETARGSYFIQTNNERALARLVQEERAAARLEDRGILAAAYAAAVKGMLAAQANSWNHDRKEAEALLCRRLISAIDALSAPPQKTQEEM